MAFFGALWNGIKWLFKEIGDNLGFNRLMEKAMMTNNLSRGMVWNFLGECLIATLIAIYSLAQAVLNKPDEILKGIDRFLLFAAICALFIVGEKYWQATPARRKPQRRRRRK